MKFYQYPKCSTCVKARKFLAANDIDFQSIDISEIAPSIDELNTMLAHYDGNIRKLFNTSGLVYRELKIKDKLSSMSNDQAIELLSKNGMLVKRPFLLNDKVGIVGFKESSWAESLL